MLTDLLYRLRALLRRGAMERELDEELRFHLERETEKLVRSGRSRDAAAREARLAFGGVERIKDDSRDVRGVAVVDAMTQDVRYALRGLRAKLGFTAAVVLTLGLGIGANAAMFGVVDRLMFRSPAYLHDPARVHRVYLYTTSRGKESADNGFEYTRYADLARWTTVFDRAATFGQRTLAIGTGEDAREIEVATVSASYFSLFDAPPALGRYFTASEDVVPAGAPVVVLAYGFWQTHYGGSAAALGRALQIDRTTFTIIGVAPDGFAGITDGAPPALFIPVTTFAGVVRESKDYYTKYSWGWLQMLVRRKPDATLAAATADLTSAYRRSLAAEAALDKTTPRFDIAKPHALAGPIQFQRGPMASRDARIITWISGVSLIVLLIACANVANLMLARALRRRREIALRVALGVGRARLLAQLLTESVILATLGGIAGLAIAQGGSQILKSIFLPADASLNVATDWRTLGFCAFVALTAGVVTGLAPAFQSGRENLALSLKAGQREGTHQRSRLRSALLVFQGTLAVVLLVGAGLFVRSLRNVRALRIGYDVDPVVVVYGEARGTVLTDLERAGLARRLEARALGIPGVESASRALTLPFWDTWSVSLFVAGIDSVRRLGRFTLQGGSPSFFRTMGTRILRGRGITAEDTKGAPKVMIVSESMARTLWPGRDAIGQCIRVQADTMPCTTVVGIAENIKTRSLIDDTGLHYYLPIEQYQPERANLIVRVRGNATDYIETVRRALQAEMPGNAYVVVHAMREVIGPQERSWQSGATMFVAFSFLALILAAIGLYSVIAFDVAQRTHELGVRIALGAQVRDVLRLIVGAGIRFAAVGVIAGLGLALAAGRFISPLLFGVSARDPVILGAVGSLLLVVAVAASAIPALRATRVDPNVALRAD
ncbi:MAG TPA: ADOP family duplicated permease [Gemmatimonadaceae bacterium]